MADQDNQARFHFDPRRGEGRTPSAVHFTQWCYETLTGPDGADARAGIAEASRTAWRDGGVGEASREVTGRVARALRTAGADIHAVAAEFGYDPTVHRHTREACTSICLSRIAAAAGAEGPAQETARQIEGLVEELLRAVRLTSEAQAVTALSHSMIERGRCDRALIAALRDEVMPETAAMIDAIWGGGPGGWDAWDIPEHIRARGA